MTKIKPPWWFCCGWWSPWCVIDTAMHDVLRVPLDARGRLGRWICDKHDDAITRDLIGRNDAA